MIDIVQILCMKILKYNLVRWQVVVEWARANSRHWTAPTAISRLRRFVWQRHDGGVRRWHCRGAAATSGWRAIFRSCIAHRLMSRRRCAADSQSTHGIDRSPHYSSGRLWASEHNHDGGPTIRVCQVDATFCRNECRRQSQRVTDSMDRCWRR